MKNGVGRARFTTMKTIRKLLPASDTRTSEDYLGTREVAALLKVSVSTVQKMVETGRLEAWKTDGGHRRIKMSSVESLALELHQGLGEVAATGQLSVLIVEDNRPTLKLYEKVLGQWGNVLKLHTANDGADALLMLARRQVDVVITDLAMKPLDGFALIHAIRADPQLSSLRVIVVTAMSPQQIERHGGLDSGVVCYEKPAPFDRIAGYLDAQLQRNGLLVAGRVLQ